MNQVGILVTNNGTHSPEKWASASASQVIQIAAEAAGEQAIEGRRLELKLLDILEGAHAVVQDEERSGLEKFGVDRYAHSIDVQEHVDGAFSEILAASKGTQFEKHFMNEAVQEHIKEVLVKDMTTEVEIERSWHKSRNHKE